MKKINGDEISNIIAEFMMKVKNNFPSIYSKEDVQELLVQLHQSLDDKCEEENEIIESPARIENVLSVIDELKDHICDDTNNYDFDNDSIDLSSAEFYLAHGNCIELEAVSFDQDIVRSECENQIRGSINDFINEYKKRNVSTESNQTV